MRNFGWLFLSAFLSSLVSAFIHRNDVPSAYSRGYAAAVDSVRSAEDFANNGAFLGMIDTGTTGDSVCWTQRGDYYGAKVLGPRTVRVTRWTR